MKNALKFILSPKGRLSRMTFTNAWTLLIACMATINFMFTTPFVYFLPIALFMVTIRRLHDINLNALYAIVIYQVYGLLAMQMNGITEISVWSYSIPLSTLTYYMMWPTLITLFYLSVKKGDDEVNRYGANPAWQVDKRVPLVEILSWRGIALRSGEKHK